MKHCKMMKAIAGEFEIANSRQKLFFSKFYAEFFFFEIYSWENVLNFSFN